MTTVGFSQLTNIAVVHRLQIFVCFFIYKPEHRQRIIEIYFILLMRRVKNPTVVFEVASFEV